MKVFLPAAPARNSIQAPVYNWQHHALPFCVCRPPGGAVHRRLGRLCHLAITRVCHRSIGVRAQVGAGFCSWLLSWRWHHRHVHRGFARPCAMLVHLSSIQWLQPYITVTHRLLSGAVRSSFSSWRWQEQTTSFLNQVGGACNLCCALPLLHLVLLSLHLTDGQTSAAAAASDGCRGAAGSA